MYAEQLQSRDVTWINGLSFTSPAGWLVQTPAPVSSTTPDIVIVGSQTSTSNPAISFTISRDNRPLVAAIDNLREIVTPLIETGALTLHDETSTQVDGNSAYLLKAVGHFEDKDGIEQKVGFSNLLIKVDDMLYTIQYSNNLTSFDAQSDIFDQVVNSIEFSDIEFAKIPVGGESDEGGYDGTLENKEAVSYTHLTLPTKA